MAGKCGEVVPLLLVVLCELGEGNAQSAEDTRFFFLFWFFSAEPVCSWDASPWSAAAGCGGICAERLWGDGIQGMAHAIWRRFNGVNYPCAVVAGDLFR